MVQVILARWNYCRHGCNCSGGGECSSIRTLTLKEKQLEAIGIHYQQAMESPLQDVSGIAAIHSYSSIETKLNLRANVSVYIVRSLYLKPITGPRNSRTSETKRIRELDQTLSFSSYWVKGLACETSQRGWHCIAIDECCSWKTFITLREEETARHKIARHTE